MVWMREFCFAMIGSLLREPILRKTTFFEHLIGGFKMPAGWLKWLPAMFRDGFLAIQAAKMPPYGGSSLDSEFLPYWNALNGFQCISMCFFALRCFRITAIFLEWIITVKRGTTVEHKRLYCFYRYRETLILETMSQTACITCPVGFILPSPCHIP